MVTTLWVRYSAPRLTVSLRRYGSGMTDDREFQTEMRDGFSVLNARMAQITAMLTTLIGDAGHSGPPAPLRL